MEDIDRRRETKMGRVKKSRLSGKWQMFYIYLIKPIIKFTYLNLILKSFSNV
jgi:hypothetical protein